MSVLPFVPINYTDPPKRRALPPLDVVQRTVDSRFSPFLNYYGAPTARGVEARPKDTVPPNVYGFRALQTEHCNPVYFGKTAHNLVSYNVIYPCVARDPNTPYIELTQYFD